MNNQLTVLSIECFIPEDDVYAPLGIYSNTTIAINTGNKLIEIIKNCMTGICDRKYDTLSEYINYHTRAFTVELAKSFCYSNPDAGMITDKTKATVEQLLEDLSKSSFKAKYLEFGDVFRIDNVYAHTDKEEENNMKVIDKNDYKIGAQLIIHCSGDHGDFNFTIIKELTVTTYGEASQLGNDICDLLHTAEYDRAWELLYDPDIKSLYLDSDSEHFLCRDDLHVVDFAHYMIIVV